MSSPPSPLLEDIRRITSTTPPATLAPDEAFWTKVRAGYVVPDDFVHLEYGYYHPACRFVLDAEIDTMLSGQRRGSHYKRNEMPADREAARSDLARIAGASPDEVIVTRNATEALNIVIHGLPLHAGDEIVHSDQDYPSVVEALDQRARRDALTLRAVPLSLDPASDDEVLERFAAAITPRTRAIVITHVLNLTGQVLPLKSLCSLARRHDLHVIVDAAHSFAQLDYTVDDLDCDYLGASLHKWLGAPLGTGLLYVRRDRIARLSPLFGDTRTAADDIRKLEHFGNSPDSAHIGLRAAIRWHEALTTPVKEARLRFLQQRWTNAVRSLPGVRLLTPRAPHRHAAIGSFAIEGREPRAIVDTLYGQHRLFVNAFDHPVVSGVRVTPGLPTSAAHVDQLIAAVSTLATAS